MAIKSIHTVFALVCLGLMATGFWGCSSLYGPTEGTFYAKTEGIERIAVLPLDRARVRPGEDRATCALVDTVYDVSEVPEKASKELTDVLWGLVENKKKFFPVPEGQCIGFLNAIIESDVKASQIRLIQEFGHELKADAVLYGIIYRYRDRSGKEYGVKQPASVAFALYLIRVRDGKVLWKYNFDETQRPLTSNLFKFRLFKEAGGKWVTARKLGEIGLKRAIEDLTSRF